MNLHTTCPFFARHDVNFARYHDIYSSLRAYSFKFEKIVSASGEIIGHEILLDFEKARSNFGVECVVQYERGIADASAIEFAIYKLANSNLKIGARYLFLNFERSHLCNRQLLVKIAHLSRKLFLNDIELILEVTERNICGDCDLIRHGLTFLKSAGVTLAVDDFDIYNGDFRVAEVLSGVYEYIKIEAPLTPTHRAVFNKFASNALFKNKKIIIERIEDADLIKGLVTPYGVQGYAYGKHSGSLFSTDGAK